MSLARRLRLEVCAPARCLRSPMASTPLPRSRGSMSVSASGTKW